MSLLCGYVPEVAKVFPRGDGIVEDLHGVVRSSATRVRVVGDDARKPNNQQGFSAYFKHNSVKITVYFSLANIVSK